MRYGILFTVKTPTSHQRKVSVMDFKRARIITFEMSEIYGDEMELDLKEFIFGMKEKIETGYWDYSGAKKYV